MKQTSLAKLVLIVNLLFFCCVASNEVCWGGEVLFARDVQPLFAKHCLLCHGPDQSEAGLRLDLAETAYTELESGERAVVPRRPEESELLRRVTESDESMRMPPEGAGLSKKEIETLRQWIRDGAEYEVHWAYRPIANSPVPEVADRAWTRNEIDCFVLARLEDAGLTPSPPAAKARLLRRLYYDLWGLPPSPEDVDVFLADDSELAYERLVDRLLASEHFGERWARHWLDKARYADSDGYEKDKPRPNAWKYRDWVIQSINTDMPFDEFTIQQLAGDLLPNATPSQQLATAFHRQTLTNTEGGADPEEFRVEATFDRTETTAAVWMALTMTCARCHSHKYDQISQHDYYQLFAFFNNSDESSIEIARSPAALDAFRKQKKAHDDALAVLEKEYRSAKVDQRPQLQAWMSDIRESLDAVDQQPVTFQLAIPIQTTTSSQTQLSEQADGSLLATGPVPAKDRYELVFPAPQEPVTVVRLELLTHDSLGKRGPGRTPHGNFVLSEIQLLAGSDANMLNATRVALVRAEADFAQEGFAADGALSAKDRTGWAIAPQTGQDHCITFYVAEPLELEDSQFLQVVLDQQYGNQHTLGRIRVSFGSGFSLSKTVSDAILAAIQVDPAERSDEQTKVIEDHFASLQPKTAGIARKISQLKSQAPASPFMPVRVMKAAKRETKRLHRGDFLQPADSVAPRSLEVLAQVHPLVARKLNAPADRLDLARWLADEDHPLTSRVIVNQVWAHLFGQGLVPTVNDFGVRGDLPSHPALLDWLAWHFPRSMRWSRKRLIKEIVMSATYRQDSIHRPELAEVDSENRLLARQHRFRVEAEVVRDLFLGVSGLLADKIGGPSVYPPLPPGVASLSYANNFKWKTSEGEDRYRRGMYTFFKRTSPHPTLISFDCPDSNTARLIRDRSNTPLQALVALNNEVFTEAAQAFARRILAADNENDAARLDSAIRMCLVRHPTTFEIEQFRGLLDRARAYYLSHPHEAESLTNRHAAAGVSRAENAAWVATLRMIINLDEFFVRD
jgi:hypothetical protein